MLLRGCLGHHLSGVPKHACLAPPEPGPDGTPRLPIPQMRHIESRPVRLMLRYRLRTQLAGWSREARYQAAKKVAWAAAEQQARRAALCATFGGWQAVAVERAATQLVMKRAQQRLGRLRMHQVLHAWRGQHGAAEAARAAQRVAQQLRQRSQLQIVLRGWRYIAWFRRTAGKAAAQQQLRVAATVFAGWRQLAVLLAARQRMLQELSEARAARLLSLAVSAWLAAVEGPRIRRQALAIERSGRDSFRCSHRSCFCWCARLLLEQSPGPVSCSLWWLLKQHSQPSIVGLLSSCCLGPPTAFHMQVGPAGAAAGRGELAAEARVRTAWAGD